MIAIDYITGVCVAVKQKKLSSKIGFAGILRKILIFVTAFLGKIMDQYILKTGNPMECAIILFYISNEGISILENLTRLGVPVPTFLKKSICAISEDGVENDADCKKNTATVAENTNDDFD